MRPRFVLPLVACLALGVSAATYFYLESSAFNSFPAPPPTNSVVQTDPADGEEQATFAAGCFWCTEAVFQRVKGVRQVLSGYSGGRVKNPSYDDVCCGTTGHAEAVQIIFNPAVISYSELLEIFWRTHDPTTRNRQGADSGTQYRSVIFYHNDRQKQLAEDCKQKINAAGVFAAPIVTEIVAYKAFYIAENYHQNYYARYGRQPYCQAVIRPKLDKLAQVFPQKLKSETE